MRGDAKHSRSRRTLSACSGIAAAWHSHSALLKAQRKCLASSVTVPASWRPSTALPLLRDDNFAQDDID